MAAIIKKSLSEGNIEKLYKTIFNFNETIDESIKKCDLTDLLKDSRNVFNTRTENVYSFPVVLKRINDTYFADKNPIYKVFKPNENVSLNMMSIEHKDNYFFLLKVDKSVNVKQTRDVLCFEYIIEKLNLPSFYKLITEDSYFSLNRNLTKGMKVSSDSETKGFLYPSQYVREKGMSDSVLKNNSNRIIIHVEN